MNYRLEAVRSSTGADFAAAYGALAGEFAPRGELERREVVADWVDAGGTAEGALRRTYHLLIARDERGELAGVRDGHVVIDRGARIAIAYLAHALVLPQHRRAGLGALLRRTPIDLVQAELAGLDSSFDVLLAAEMEPVVETDEASIVRLLAYGREGFAAIDPGVLPYFQPDFRDLSAIPDARPIALLAVVRWLGHEGAAALPKRLARAFVRHLYAVFATHVRAEHLADLEAGTLGALEAWSSDDVPLLALPRSVDDRAAIERVSRERLPHVRLELTP